MQSAVVIARAAGAAARRSVRFEEGVGQASRPRFTASSRRPRTRCAGRGKPARQGGARRQQHVIGGHPNDGIFTQPGKGALGRAAALPTPSGGWPDARRWEQRKMAGPGVQSRSSGHWQSPAVHEILHSFPHPMPQQPDRPPCQHHDLGFRGGDRVAPGRAGRGQRRPAESRAPPRSGPLGYRPGDEPLVRPQLNLPEGAVLAWPPSADAFAILFIAASLGLYSCGMRQGQGHKLVNVGLAYEVVLAFAVGIVNQWNPAVLGGRLSWLLRAHPDPAPSCRHPRKALIASVLAASMDPVGLFVAHLRGVELPISRLLFWAYLPTTSARCSRCAVQIIMRLGRQVSRAREMGSYRLADRIGEGGMGEDRRAHHRLLARPAAIKLIRPGRGDEDSRARDRPVPPRGPGGREPPVAPYASSSTISASRATGASIS